MRKTRNFFLSYPQYFTEAFASRLLVRKRLFLSEFLLPEPASGILGFSYLQVKAEICIREKNRILIVILIIGQDLSLHPNLPAITHFSEFSGSFSIYLG